MPGARARFASVPPLSFEEEDGFRSQRLDAPAGEAGRTAPEAEPEDTLASILQVAGDLPQRLQKRLSTLRLLSPSATPRAQEAGREAALATLERQLDFIEHRVDSLERQGVSNRLEVLEKVFERAFASNGGPSVFSRVSHLERVLEDVRKDVLRSRTMLEVRVGTTLAGLQQPQAEREQWERRVCGLERRMAELVETTDAAFALSGAHRGDPPSQLAVRGWGAERGLSLERQVAALEGRLAAVEAVEGEACRGGEADAAGRSLDGSLDLDKQVFDLDLEVATLRDRLTSAFSHGVGDPRVDPLETAVGNMDMKVDAAAASIQDLRHRVSALDMVQGEIQRKQRLTSL